MKRQTYTTDRLRAQGQSAINALTRAGKLTDYLENYAPHFDQIIAMSRTSHQLPIAYWLDLIPKTTDAALVGIVTRAHYTDNVRTLTEIAAARNLGADPISTARTKTESLAGRIFRAEGVTA